MQMWPGQAFPLGATYDGNGTNFSVFSEVAERIEVCLFDDARTETRATLPEVTAYIHHGYLPGVQPAQRYGFRIHGPSDPGKGLVSNPSKLLVDPYAKAVEGEVDWSEAVFPYHFATGPDGPVNEADSASFVPMSVVTSPFFDWGDDRHPRTPWFQTVVYETHVRGLTMRHPDVPEELRGTYSGLCAPPVIDHLKRIGVTAVELMPVHQFIHDHRLHEIGLRNYWGYNSIAYLAPHNAYASYGQRGQQVQEFKQFVKTLHAEGIEVILDVVYNHTAEGDHSGPMLGFKGIDNPAYYRLDPDNPRRYVDYTGTGNSLNMRHPHVLQLVMDSLRYWVLEMHVDGFRFDLAATLARELHDVDKLSSFFDLIQQDPVVSQVKLIAEPWDVGEGGYQVGNFPPLWSEWNGKFRDEVRDFWRGADHTVAEFGYRFTGSSDLYESNGRTPSASINFVTCHDGFTLTDLVSYDQKHNDANGEEGRDGASDNRSWNCGAEGATDDPAITALRRRQRRNLLTTLFLSQGVPMLLGGDEIGRTQQGNNNAYNQDNDISYHQWAHSDEDLVEFVHRLAKLRRGHPVFRRRRWFQGRAIAGDQADIAWYTPEGRLMTADDWQVSYARSIAVHLNGDAIAALGSRGERTVDNSFFMIFNASDGALDVVLPPVDGTDGDGDPAGSTWITVLDTVPDDPDRAIPRDPVLANQPFRSGDSLDIPARSIRLLRLDP